jgi:hypothetical protein
LFAHVRKTIDGGSFTTLTLSTTVAAKEIDDGGANGGGVTVRDIDIEAAMTKLMSFANSFGRMGYSFGIIKFIFIFNKTI